MQRHSFGCRRGADNLSGVINRYCLTVPTTQRAQTAHNATLVKKRLSGVRRGIAKANDLTIVIDGDRHAVAPAQGPKILNRSATKNECMLFDIAGEWRATDYLPLGINTPGDAQ